MIVHVEYTGQLRNAAGQSSAPVELPEGSHVQVLLERLGTLAGAEVRPHLLTSEGSVQPSLLVAVNGAARPAQQCADTLLRDGDTVVLLPPIAGG